MQGIVKQELRNARITSTLLGFEEHGIFTFQITLDYGATVQTCGGLNLNHTPGLAALLASLLHVLHVNAWEELPGQIVRVHSENGRVVAIGHILGDGWFSFPTALPGSMPAKE